MRYWITTDTHVDHKNIIKYCNRPENCDELIMDGLSLVGPRDVIVHLGDVAFSSRGEEEYMMHLPYFCKKWLILGNHDKSMKYHIESGWDWAGESMTIRRHGKLIKFSHKPVPIGEEDIQIHGHFHNNPMEYCEGWLQEYYTSKHYLLVLEDVNYMPVRLHDILKRV